jgi:hypothetical protein
VQKIGAKKKKRMKTMKIKMGYSMGYAGTDTEWTEEVPEDVVAEGQEAIDAYVDATYQHLYDEACGKISVWAEIEE